MAPRFCRVHINRDRGRFLVIMLGQSVRSVFLLSFSIILTSLFGLGAHAGQYVPPGLYDVRFSTLANGLHVILKKRTHAHNIAIRLIVEVGHRHFDCDKRETAHFLEHLLFTGTSRHSETELDRLIEDHGGSWNASTDQVSTHYQIDIFDRHQSLAIDTLYEIITDTAITLEKIELTRDIIHRELGGEASALRRWLYERGIGKSATTKAYETLLPGQAVVCPALDSPDGVTEAGIRQAYSHYYVPDKMSLIVVGNFDEPSLLNQIKQTFGRLPRSGAPHEPLIAPPYPDRAAELTGTLSPLLDSSATVAFAYRTEGKNSVDLHALWVLYIHLNRVLYERIRVGAGLSYNPQAAYLWETDYGVFAASADTEIDQIETVKVMLQEELDTLRRVPPSNEDIESAKRRILLARVQGFESNADVAGYYVSHLHELTKSGRLIDHEAIIAALTPLDVHAVAAKYLRKDRQVVIRSTPTLTYTQFYTLLAVIVTALLGVGIYGYWRILKRRQV